MDRIAEMKKLNLNYSKIPYKTKNWDLSKVLVQGEGPLDAKVMFIGQAPGRNEDVERRPFIGTSGKFLTQLMTLAGIDRKSVYICSVVQFFPPLNRMPTDEEIELCKEFLFKQIDIVNPKLVVLLGALASKTVANVEKVGTNHGTIIEKEGRTYFISMHPAAAVRIRTKIPVMEKDFKKLRTVVKKIL